MAEKLAAVSTLASGIAVELTNPLAGLRSNLEFIQQQLGRATALMPNQSRTELNAALAEALQGADRIAGLVDSIRLFAEDDPVAVGPTQLRRIVDAAIRMAWPLIGRRARFEQQLQPVPEVIATGSRLAQVVLKLLVNAAESIAEGTPHEHSITIATWFDETANEVVLEVADTGVGMPPQDAARPFDLQLHATGGAGVLGLPLVYRLVTSMGGGMTIDSNPKFGTRVQVMLPPVSATVRPA